MASNDRAKPWQIAVFFVVAMAIAAARRPDALSRPQFWAEDGAVWYAQAHDLGAFPPLLRTQDGYFSTDLRILAALSLALPFAAVPLFFALCAFALQAAPAAFFLSRRFARAAPDLAARFGIALLYLVLPNTGEIHGNITNAQWYLALLACMVVLAEPAASAAWQAVDAAVLALAGLSGPYAVFLAPLAFLRWRSEKTTQRKTQTVVLSVCGAAQLAALMVLNGGTRFHVLPRPDIVAFATMLGKQVFTGGLIGVGGYLRLVNGLPAVGPAVVAAIAAAGMALVAFAAVRGPWQLRYLLAFAAANLAASLAAPNLGPLNRTSDFAALAWRRLADSSSGSRYWFLPVLAWLLCLVWGVSRANAKTVRAASAALLLLIVFGIATDLRDAEPMDARFAAQAGRYASARPGEIVEMPIAPAGWSMTVTKK